MKKIKWSNFMGAMGLHRIVRYDAVPLGPYIPFILVHSSPPQNSTSTQEIKIILTKQTASACILL